MLKPIPPTQRERNRYIVFELISSTKFDRNSVVRCICNSVLDFIGEAGAGKTSLWAMDWDEEKQIGILKVNHRSVDDVRASAALMKEINNSPVIFHVLGVSGTLKIARSKYVR